MTISMALVDFIPCIMFLISAVLLQRGLYEYFSKGAFALFAGGTIMIIAAGFFKATWKLLYALGVCDFEKLNHCFFPMQSTGFFLAAIGLLALMTHKQGTKTLVLAVPAVYSGTMIFVTIMCLGVVGMNVSLAVLAARRKKIGIVILYSLTIIFMLGMGYLSSKDFSNPAMNWAGELTNILGQGLFLFGNIKLLNALKEESK